MSTLVAHQLVKDYGCDAQIVHVLRGVDYTFESGHSYAISGVSGTGKSTLVHLLAGLDVPTSGHVLFNGHEIETFSATQRSHFLNHSIGLVFQAPYLIKELSVVENVMLKGLVAQENYASCMGQARQLLDILGLADKADTQPTTLSGGQQQRVAIARALFGTPAFVLADEPTGNLDAESTDRVLEVLGKFTNVGLIVTSHNERVCARMQAHLELENGLLAPMAHKN